DRTRHVSVVGTLTHGVSIVELLEREREVALGEEIGSLQASSVVELIENQGRALQPCVRTSATACEDQTLASHRDRFELVTGHPDVEGRLEVRDMGGATNLRRRSRSTPAVDHDHLRMEELSKTLRVAFVEDRGQPPQRATRCVVEPGTLLAGE